ncbi:tail protein P2 I [Alkalispirillum mobile]|uniref:Tail protein P2 I n=1 Tax=Alkalispirillum mobile TaxID=85925 RepID=A0A498C5N5_9GAMM|nr:phage tail protein [Alkalispirillum mobile]RLK50613.1 tail protein P2 I [Alkalispirillum mobile]
MSRSSLAEQLYQLLPAVYRERDRPGGASRGAPPGEGDPPEAGTEPGAVGDLEALLQVYGRFLDRWRNTLDQRYYDNFPDRDPRRDALGRERNCQPWLLPYLARLVDVDLVSPDTEGQREEVTHAVAWRQRKGTRAATEAIAEAVGRMETEVQEGWQRVARTPRIGDPLLPEAHYGVAEPIPGAASPALRARHPGLPTATPDLRYASRPLRTRPGDPAARRTHYAGEPQHWVQANPGGVPCFPGSHQDVSRRTPDLRTPDERRGHYHPRRALLYLAPPEGLCHPDAPGLHWETVWERVGSRDHYRDEEIECHRRPVNWRGETWTCLHLRARTARPLRLVGREQLGAQLDGERVLFRFEHLWFDNRLTLERGRLVLQGCALRHLEVATVGDEGPAVVARGCLFNRLAAPGASAELEYCTVLDQLLATRLWMSDSISVPVPRGRPGGADLPATGCIRYSRLPHVPEAQWQYQGEPSALRLAYSTHRQAVFLDHRFGEPGAGVLHWHCPEAITRGAEDGGEMGAYHDARHQLRWQAVRDKLSHYLPLGIEAVLIPDPRLQCPPPYRA